MTRPLAFLAGVLAIAALVALGRALPGWTLSLATVAASHASVALGIVVLMRAGTVSFGQGLFFAVGGYGAAFVANTWGVVDAFALVAVGGLAGALVGAVFGPLLARYRGIFFGMLTLALSMVLYGALMKSTGLGGSDGFNVGRPTFLGREFADAREADFALYALSVVLTGAAGLLCAVYFRSERGLVSLAARENALRVEYLGASVRAIIAVNFVIAALLAGVGGALTLMAQRHIDPQYAYWTTSGEFVFIAILAGYQSVTAVFLAAIVLELVRSFSNLYFPNTWQLALGVFLLLVILLLPNGLGSLWSGRRPRRAAVGRPDPAVAVLAGSKAST